MSEPIVRRDKDGWSIYGETHTTPSEDYIAQKWRERLDAETARADAAEKRTDLLQEAIDALGRARVSRGE